MPVVVLYGDESYLLEQAVLKLRAQTVNPAMASLTHRIYRAPNLAQVLEAVGSVGLALGGQTLVEIRDFVYMTQAAKDDAAEAQLDELKALLETVEAHKTVLFTGAKVDGKFKFTKWLLKHPGFQIQKFEAYKFWETDRVADTVLSLARQRQISVATDAVELLVATLGTDLRTILGELDKLALYAHNREITAQDVALLSNSSDNLFLLINDWILNRLNAGHFKALQEMLLKRHPVELFAPMQGYFNNILRVVWLSRQGMPLEAIAQQTGQKPFTIKKHLAQFNRVPTARFQVLRHQLVELEWKTKTGQMDGHLALETLLGAATTC